MSKSIIQQDDSICYLCGGYGASEWHHIFGGPYRKKSERHGLKVRLHHNCHNEPPDGAHFNKDAMLKLHQAGQKAAMETFGWTVERFIQEYGKNYL